MKNERGYSLVEFLVALTIIGILAVMLGVAFPQMSSVPEKGQNQADALHALQNVIHWVSQDAGSAKSAVVGDSLTLTMPDDSVVSYTKTGDVLYRHHGSESTMVAQNITSLSFAKSSRLITMSITAMPDSRWNISESRTYQIAMRPSGT